MALQERSTTKKLCQITFSSRDDEIQHIKKLMANYTTFNGDPERLITWLKETGAFIAKEGYSDTDHPYIICRLLLDDALDYYLAHDDLIFNFYDLCKLFLYRQNILAQSSRLSQIAQKFPLMFFPNPIDSHCANSDWPPGTETWYSSSPLPPRQSHSISSPHHFHPQHERDYLLTKSLSSYPSNRTPVYTPLIDTVQCTGVESFWPDGSTSWFTAPLSPRLPLFCWLMLIALHPNH